MEERLLRILKICRTINSERNLAELLELIAREATEMMSADRASIFLLDEKRRALWSPIALGTKDTLRFDARLGIAGACVLSARPVNVRDAYEDPRFNPAIDTATGYRTGSVLAVPMLNREGQTVGVFEILNKKGGGIFTGEDEEVLCALAAQAAIAIETAQLFEELRNHKDHLLDENRQLRKEVEGGIYTARLLGNSEQFQKAVALIHRISDSSATVLIRGESGTGKELAAKAIHFGSARSRFPFVAVNCAALPETLLESELFGIEKGVASGVEKRIGQFEAANFGTLFLDEIGDMGMAAQAKILRALEERVIERLGGRKTIPIDVRVLAATHKNLEDETKLGHFRADLYYRLKVIQIDMPALRQIPEDIPLLANYYLGVFSQELKREQKSLGPDALQCLVNYSWPGNARQLRNEMQRLTLLAPGKVIVKDDLSGDICGSPARKLQVGALKEAVAETVAGLEKEMILEALRLSGNNQGEAARHLGLSRQGLIKKMKRYGPLGAPRRRS